MGEINEMYVISGQKGNKLQAEGAAAFVSYICGLTRASWPLSNIIECCTRWLFLDPIQQESSYGVTKLPYTKSGTWDFLPLSYRSPPSPPLLTHAAND